MERAMELSAEVAEMEAREEEWRHEAGTLEEKILILEDEKRSEIH